jgi:protein tyrosine phosphatase
MVYHSISDDHSRVKLQNTENDYINASLIDIEEAQRSYVLTQASSMILSRCLKSGVFVVLL